VTISVKIGVIVFVLGLAGGCQTSPRSGVTPLPERPQNPAAIPTTIAALRALTPEEEVKDAVLNEWCSQNPNFLKLIIVVDDSVSKLPTAVARRNS
jgi:hypothetical protein